MRATRNKQMVTYRMSKDLKTELANAKSELEGKEKYRDYHEWKFDCAKKEFDAFMRRYNDLKGFIKLAEEKLKEQENEKSGE